MKFTANKEDFFNSLQKVIGVLPTKTTIPILGNVLLRLENSKLNILGTDLEISISTYCEVNGSEDGALSVPGKRFFEIVRELPNIPITVETDVSNHLTLANEKGVYKFVGESEDEFPHIAVEEAEFEFALTGEKFIRMVEKTMYAASTDELRTTLMGVYLQIFPNELRMVATDGHRLAKITDKSFSSDQTASAILPLKALQLVTRNLQPDTSLTIAVGENHVVFSFDETRVYTKVIEGQYPNYERVIPLDNQLELFVNRDMLMAAVKRVSIFSNQFTHQIKFSLSPSSLVIQAEDVEMGGEAQESIPVDYSGKSMVIGYNAMYLLDILRQIETQDVLFQLKDAGSAAIVKPSEQNENEELMMLLMPIRLSDTV